MKINNLKFLYYFTILLNVSVIFAQNSQLNKNDIALIEETFHLQKELGNKIWKNWKPQKIPFLYKKGVYKYLIFHKKPPKGYKKLKKSIFSNAIYYKKTIDTLNYSAMFPINGIETLVISKPLNDDNKCEWILKVVHEMFHVFQKENITKELNEEQNFRINEHTKENELNFPYKYFDSKRLAIEKLEAEKVFNAILKDSLNENEKRIYQRRFADIYYIQQLLIKDTTHIKYKANMEWKEGVARYTEQQLAVLASNAKTYHPTKAFKKHYPKSDYTTLSQRYKKEASINPIRFVGEGVIGRLMFYYMGMGKAYLLDKLDPNWKEFYFNKTLDELIIGEEQFLSCKNYIKANKIKKEK